MLIIVYGIFYVEDPSNSLEAELYEEASEKGRDHNWAPATPPPRPCHLASDKVNQTCAGFRKELLAHPRCSGSEGPCHPTPGISFGSRTKPKREK